MPLYCIICFRWFQPQSCNAECDTNQEFNNLCGMCSGVGPMGQVVKKPHAMFLSQRQMEIAKRREERKAKAEEMREIAENLKKEDLERQKAAIAHRRQK